jgi:HAD superfamily hydrolase (TIGR01509 family)
VRAVVFDFDGLILDTESPIFHSWREAFAAHGVQPLTTEEWAAEIGTHRGIDLLEVLRERAGRLDDAILAARVERRDALLALETVRPGVLAWIAEAEARGLALAIASSSEREWVVPHLERLGLGEHFAYVSCREESLPAKPEPDLYLDACASLGVEPEGAIAIEDSPHGVAAAKAAGLRCVAVPNPVTAAYDLSAADLVIESLESLTLAEALRALGTTDAPDPPV